MWNIDDRMAAKVRARLESDIVGWLTTVSPEGVPQPSPVWFILEGEELIVYSRRSARVRNIEANPGVAFNLDGNGDGGEIVVFEATARIDSSLPPADRRPDYVAKYQHKIDAHDWTWEWFTTNYPVPIRITPTRLRAW